MKKLILCLITCLFLLTPVNTLAYSYENVYSETDIDIETVIIEEISPYSTNTKTGTKKSDFVDGSGNILFSISVTGTFRYDGSTSTCTSAEIKTSISHSSWKITSQSASKSGNKAIGKATAKRYFLGVAYETKNESVILTCDKNGKLS